MDPLHLYAMLLRQVKQLTSSWLSKTCHWPPGCRRWDLPFLPLIALHNPHAKTLGDGGSAVGFTPPPPLNPLLRVDPMVVDEVFTCSINSSLGFPSRVLLVSSLCLTG